MWKTHFTVDVKRLIFHSPCGNNCGKPGLSVEKSADEKVFHISTAPISDYPVEMWKTLS
jgi:hypothetical protein